MKRVSAILLERLADGLASVSLRSAVGFPVFHVVAPVTVQPALGAYAAAAALIAYWASQLLLNRVGRRSTRLPVARTAFCNALPTPVAAPESATVAVTDTLFDSSSVVQMFEPATISACGQSTGRAGGRPGDLSPAVPADASRSLHEALDQLRESLR